MNIKAFISTVYKRMIERKSIIGYGVLLALAILIFSIPWYSGHYSSGQVGRYEERNVNGWDLIEWQWNKTLDDSSFPYLIGVALGIIAMATRKHPPIPLVLTLIAGIAMLFAVWQCLITGYNSSSELALQPPEVIKAGGALAFMIPVAYLIVGSILCHKW